MNIYKKQKVKILKRLNIKDKAGEWIQIEVLTGENKGMRLPIAKEELR